jgi:hypothetical protein
MWKLATGSVAVVHDGIKLRKHAYIALGTVTYRAADPVRAGPGRGDVPRGEPHQLQTEFARVNQGHTQRIGVTVIPALSAQSQCFRL